MKQITLRLCLALPMFFLPGPSLQEATNSSSCSSESAETMRLTDQLKESLDCVDTLASVWADNETASVLSSLTTAVKVLQGHQKSACLQAHPKQCPAPGVPSKGGLVCATIGDARYCKPMCNEGFDFDFLRRSRLYEECKAGIKPTWTTQYIGGKTLAICNKAAIAISGATSAYFPKDQDCLKTKSESDLEREVIQTFVSELKAKGIRGTAEYKCLTCG
ncbi:uncharacterized protein si:ch1073-126c3.2 [Conger conger]|uniref:uncharacterized protein si:ch1073-126c3.2 n=1 Tax=Conger conger TaxID=82655 RepID=UPI002A599060|nr:uncharacterized protein si:ch1073-126c3.2 [Conger conger]